VTEGQVPHQSENLKTIDMQDMLVRLYTLPDISDQKKRVKDAGIVIRRPLGAEKSLTVEWVRQRFGSGWASEVDVSFSYQPVTCFIAVEKGSILGFACYDSAYRNFFGPTGVDESAQGKGIGKVLLFSCLEAMREQGYAYAIIGGAGPVDFYRKTVGAELIPGSNPGIYEGIMSELPLH
jgi:GNAT superfamily N-acetyltransferase